MKSERSFIKSHGIEKLAIQSADRSYEHTKGGRWRNAQEETKHFRRQPVTFDNIEGGADVNKFLLSLMTLAMVMVLVVSSASAAIETFSFTIKNTGYEFTQMDKNCRNKKVYKDQKWSMIVDSFSVTSGTPGAKVGVAIMRETSNIFGHKSYTACGNGWIAQYRNYDNCHFGWYSGEGKVDYYYCPAGRTDSEYHYTMSMAGRFNADKVTFPNI